MLMRLNELSDTPVSMSKLATDRQLTAWAISKIRELTKGDWTQTSIAQAIGVDKGWISKLLSRSTENAGEKVQRGLIAILKITPNDMHSLAIEYAKKHPDELAPSPDKEQVVRPDRYENRALAAAVAKDEEIDDRAIALVLSKSYSMPDDKRILEWVEIMRKEERAILRADAGLRPAGRNPAVDPADYEQPVAPWEKDAKKKRTKK